MLLFGSLVSLAHLSGYLLGFDSYLIRVVLLIAMMMTVGFVSLAERNRLSSELLGIAKTNVAVFRALSVALIVGSLTVGSYASAFSQGTQFEVRTESRNVRLSDGTDRAMLVVPTPSGGFFLVEDVFGTFAAEKLLPGEETRLAAGMELSLPGYAETAVAEDDGTNGWKIRRAWWLAYESRLPGAPREYASLADPSLVERLSPPPVAPTVPEYSPTPAAAPVAMSPVPDPPTAPAASSRPSSATRAIKCADLPDSVRTKFCKSNGR